MNRPVRVAAPAATPVTLGEAKEHLRVAHTDDDALINSMIEAATDHLDGYSGTLGRCIVSQTWRQDFDCWIRFRLPFPNVRNVVVTYLDADGATQTVDPADYRVADVPAGPFVEFVPGWVRPVVQTGRSAVISVTFEAGFGVVAVVPQALKMAIKLHVQELYDGTEKSPAYGALVAPYRWATL